MQISSRWTRARGMSLLTILVFLLKTLNDGLPVHSSPTSSPGASGEFRDKTKLNSAIGKTLRGFVCGEPQQRAYNLMDLMNNLSLHSSEEIANQPTYLVMNRCDVHSGCCGAVGKSCSPKSTYFEAVQIEILNLAKNCLKKVWLKVEHHDECHCKETNSSERSAFATQLPNVIALGDHSNAPCKKNDENIIED